MLYTRTDGFLQNVTTYTKLHAIASHIPCCHVNLYTTLTHVKFIISVTELGTSWLNDL